MFSIEELTIDEQLQLYDPDSSTEGDTLFITEYEFRVFVEKDAVCPFIDGFTFLTDTALYVFALDKVTITFNTLDQDYSSFYLGDGTVDEDKIG